MASCILHIMLLSAYKLTAYILLKTENPIASLFLEEFLFHGLLASSSVTTCNHQKPLRFAHLSFLANWKLYLFNKFLYYYQCSCSFVRLTLIFPRIFNSIWPFLFYEKFIIILEFICQPSFC